MTHDKLQSECFRWMWNTHPELRGLFWGTFNDIKQVEKTVGNVGNKKRMIILASMKSLGMVKGIVDFMFYYKGVLHVIDFKVAGDTIKPEQKLHMDKVVEQGGKAYEIRSVEEFKEVIGGVVYTGTVITDKI